MLQGNLVAKVVSHGDVSRAVDNSTVSPRAVLTLEVDQTPMTLRRHEGATRGAKAAFPVVECLLHFWNQIRACVILTGLGAH